MEKRAYLVTDKAGLRVAGVRSPGAGQTIHLTAAQAVHPLRIGHIVAAPADDERAPRRRLKAD